MAKLRSSHIAKEKSNSNGIIKKLQKSLNILGHKPSSSRDKVPKDVKEGHFAVIAVEEDEENRFIVPLSYLTHPSFMILLEESAEEYRFGHEGALTLPCRPCELQVMLDEREGSVSMNPWGTSCVTMVESC